MMWQQQGFCISVAWHCHGTQSTTGMMMCQEAHSSACLSVYVIVVRVCVCVCVQKGYVMHL